MKSKYLFLILMFVLAVSMILLFPERVSAATYVVTKTANTNDGVCDADCSLREAVTAANSNIGADVINFDVPTSDGGYVAPSGGVQGYFDFPTSATLSLTDSGGVFIDGYSQSGASRNTTAFGQTMDTVLKVQISVTLGSGLSTITFASNNNHVAGISILYAIPGFSINPGSNNWIEGCFFSTNMDGMESSNIYAQNGNTILNGSHNNIIGTNGDGIDDRGERNLFMGSSTQYKIQFSTGTNNGNVVAGNYFGVDKTGRTCESKVQNRAMVSVLTAGTGNRVGSNLDGISDSEEANILACVNANARGEIQIGAGAVGTIVQGNFIGTNTYDDNLNAFAVPGIRDNSAAIQSIIKRNIIRFNGGGGVRFVYSTSYGNTITENNISNNGSLGIDFAVVGSGAITANDVGDIDVGENDLMNFPVLDKMGIVDGTLITRVDLDLNPAEAPYTIDFYDNDALHVSGNGEGQKYIGSVVTSSYGNDVGLTVPMTGFTPSAISKITATATNSGGSTSEFSAASADTTTYSVIVSGTMVINEGDEVTNEASLNLQLTATGELFSIAEMKLSEDSDYEGADWEAFSTTKVFSLLGDGTKTVYAKFKDSAGNESDTYSESILLDTTSPTGTASFGDEITSELNHVITLSATDVLTSVVEMRISESDSFVGASWESYAMSKNVVLSTGDGIKTMYVQFKDGAGNESPSVLATITLDTTFPRSVRITDIGLIPSIPNLNSLFYFFTSQVPRIKGTAEPFSRVSFKSSHDGHVYQTVTNSLGAFSIILKDPVLPRGPVSLEYYSQDLVGNKSVARTLKLVIGEENFPIEEVKEDVVEEEIPEMTPTPTIEITEIPTPIAVITEAPVTTTEQIGLFDRIIAFFVAMWTSLVNFLTRIIQMVIVPKTY